MKDKKDETTDEVEIDATVVDAIAEKVVKGLDIDKKVSDAVQAGLTSQAETIEKTITKNIKNAEVKSNAAEDRAPKELMLVRSVRALITGNTQKLVEANKQALELRAKAGYANSTVDADGGYLVLQPEFEAEIEKLVPNYGVAFREANVVPVNSPVIETNKRGSNVRMFEVTTEGGQKQGTKMSILQQSVTLREFAAIAPVTNRLSDDSAIDFWAELTAGFAEERGRIADEMVFTESSVATPGILHLPGTIVEGVGAAITSITWDDLLNAESKIPSAAQANLKYYMHRTIWNILLQGKDLQGRYQLMPASGFRTPWGREVVFVDVMPAASSYGDANEGYVVLGDLKRTKLYVKRGLELTIASEATVHDADGNAINLFERNMKALRAETRMIQLTKFPEAFAVIGTGTVS